MGLPINLQKEPDLIPISSGSGPFAIADQQPSPVREHIKLKPASVLP